MKSIKAPRPSVSRSAASIPSLILLGALSGSALAATDIQQPCPEAAAEADVLQAFIADDPAPLVRTVEASDTESSTQASDDETSVEADETKASTSVESSTPAYTTQLPGVSANDMPGFRRHMYRTDI